MSNDLEQLINELDPNDPATADKLLAYASAGELEDGEEMGGHDERQELEKDEKQGGEPSSTENDEPKGVLTRDGKHVIPYSELESARERAARAEQMLQETAGQLEALQAGRISPEEVPPIDEETMQLLEDELPGVAKALRAQQSLLESLKTENHQFKTKEQREQEARQQDEQKRIDDAVSANERLSAWKEAAFRKENPDPELWNQAADADALLRNSKAWASKPLEERFAKAVEMVMVANGMTATKKQGDDLDQKLDSALGGKSKPRSLSEFPSGSPAGMSLVESLENASATEIASRFTSMSKEQIERALVDAGIASF